MAEGTDVVLAFEAQAGKGTPASGAGAQAIEVRPGSTGLAQTVATIRSTRMRRNRMSRKPRQGSRSVSADYETELTLGLDALYAAVLGGTETATFDLTEAEMTNVAISGTGTVATMGGGSLLTEGVVSGMMGKFTNLSTSGNNGKWFPILDPTATTFGIPSGIIADNATDSAFTLTIAKALSTPTPYVKTYYTVEEYLGSELDFSKRGIDMRFNSLRFGAAPDQPVTVGFGLAGRDMDLQSAGSAPVFTTPTYGQVGDILLLLDGAIYIDGVANVNLTGASAGITAPASFLPMLSGKISPDVYMGMFDFAGQFSGAIVDDAIFQAYEDESAFDVLLRFGTPGADPFNTSFVTVYIGNCSWGGWNAPIAAGALVENMPLYAGSDGRGDGYQDSIMVVSTVTV